MQQLVVSDGVNSVLVWDLRTPLGTAPTIYPVPNVPDGMDYDTINQTVYVVNDTAPYNLTGISLTKNMVVSQTTIPFSADLIKFNPRDGKIYIACMEDADHNNASAGIDSGFRSGDHDHVGARDVQGELNLPGSRN